MRSRTPSTKNTKSSSPKDETLQYIKYQSLLILLMLVFVGIICIPSLLEQVSLKKKSAAVQKVYYNDGSLSVVDIQVGKVSYEKRQVSKNLRDKDNIVVYISNRNNLYHKKASPLCLWLVIIYFFLLASIVIFTVWTFL